MDHHKLRIIITIRHQTIIQAGFFFLIYISLSLIPIASPQRVAMVELVEVEDESFETKQVGPSDDEDYTDTGMHNSQTQHSIPQLTLLSLRV